MSGREPRVEVGVAGSNPTLPATRPSSTRESEIRVLLVEESNTEAELLQDKLSRALFTVHHVTHVSQISEAVRLLTEERFDVLLLALSPPDSSGLETLHRIQSTAEAHALPIVLISESVDESLALEATSTGAQDYVINGEFDSRVLIRTIQQAIERRRMANRLQEAHERETYLATHDRLTGLPNRYLFMDRLSHSLHAARRHRRWLGVLFLDLDRFNAVNETFGHSVGDQLLQVAGRRLQGCLRATDVAARVGANAFAVLLSDLSQGLDAANVARNIEQNLGNPFRLTGNELYVTASIGIAVYPNDGVEAEVLMNHAETALKSAKNSGGNTRRFFTAGMDSSATRLLTLEMDLRKAIEVDQEQFIVHFQPIVDGRTGRITGAEALLRWSHPSLGMIAPSEFIPVAETRGLIIPIGAWVLRTTCLQIRRWQDAGYPLIPIAVNVSPTQFWHADFLGLIMQTLLDTGVNGAFLQLEVTESCVMREMELVREVLGAVRQFNVQISIDDFGTGFSSLSVLQQLPIDVLKIDRSFVRDCSLDSRSSRITSAIIGLAKNLGMGVVAEGVETDEQRMFLLEQDCPTMQGFLFSSAVSADQLGRVISDGCTVVTDDLSGGPRRAR